jgi:hypothetical protein
MKSRKRKGRGGKTNLRAISYLITARDELKYK